MKIRFSVLSVLCSVFVFANVLYANNPIGVFEPLENYDMKFEGYVVKDGNLYINVFMSSKINESDKEEHIYKFNKEKLNFEKIKHIGEKWFIDNRLEYDITKIDNDPDFVFSINENTKFTLQEEGGMYQYKIILYKDNKVIDKFKGYEVNFKNNDYLYIDKTYSKIYFPGFGILQNTHGIYVYDTKNEKISSFAAKDNININIGSRYGQPIRIPNTEYMMYVEDITAVENIAGIKITTKPTFKIWIQEIPEWKAEMEGKASSAKIDGITAYVQSLIKSWSIS